MHFSSEYPLQRANLEVSKSNLGVVETNVSFIQITTSLIDGGLPSHTLMLADTESEKAKWVVALSELHRILKRNNLPNTAIFRVREVLDSSLTMLRGAQSALIIDPDRILLGTEDGLFCLDLDRSGMC